MLAKQIIPSLYVIPLGIVNVFLVELDGLTLIDTGSPGEADKILLAIDELGKQPTDIRHILVTHAHPDHIGSLAAMQKATGADVYVHVLDAKVVRTGTGAIPLKPPPGIIMGLMNRLYLQPFVDVEPTAVDHEINDGNTLPFAGDLQVIHVPGHCIGQVAFLWKQHGGVLFAADVCSNIMGLNWSVGYEDVEVGKRSLKKLAALDFEVACFGHGSAITQHASRHFKKKWA